MKKIYAIHLREKECLGIQQTVSRVTGSAAKVFAAKSGALSWIPATYAVEGENRLSQVVL